IDVEVGGGTAAGQPGEQQQIPEQFREFFRQFPFFGDPGQGGGQGQMQPMPEPRRQGVGSGWVYSADGYIVTNAHVVADATRVTVVLHDREVPEEVAATVVGTDPRTELAVLKVDVDRQLPFLRLGNSDNLKVAQWVMAVGAPLQLEQTVTVGVVSAKSRILEPDPTLPFRLGDIIQTDASINPGNSGGPLVNLQGDVVGINVAYASPGRVGNIGIGFAIAASTAQRVVPELMQGRQIQRGWLGVKIEDLNANLREFYGVPAGIRIAGIDQNGPASRSELQVDDIVTGVGGKPVRETYDLQREVADRAPGATLELNVMRNRQERTVNVTLGGLPSELTGLPAPTTPTPEEETAQWPLGIRVMEISDLTPQIGAEMGIECQQGAIIGINRDKGLVVRAVDANSPASGRVIPGDVVDKVNGNAVTSVQQYREQMDAAVNGDRDFVVLHLIRVVEGEVVTRVVDIELP
ncbi:MAG TPA: hypothetical protein DEP45_05750, partial [Armatimonadetes bacterium]|nr:hypothetical protein [Armatimonadota bacterium]